MDPSAERSKDPAAVAEPVSDLDLARDGVTGPAMTVDGKRAPLPETIQRQQREVDRIKVERRVKYPRM